MRECCERVYHGQVAVETATKLDARTLRADFPIFEQEIHGKPLAFLDSAASSQKPRQMLEAMTEFYETSYANVHRGVYELAERATEASSTRARRRAPSSTRPTCARSSSSATRPRRSTSSRTRGGSGTSAPATSSSSPSSSTTPTSSRGSTSPGKTGAELRDAPARRHGELDLSGLDALARDGNVKVVATNLVSNSLGTINPVDKLVAWAHEQGAIFVCDAAQAAPHMKLDVQALGADFVAISGHKMCGPSGVGALWGKTELLQAMEPFMTGGHMISSVRLDKTTWGELPHKFEAGTAPMAEAVGLGAAIDYLEAIGLDAIEAHEHELTAYALGRLAEVPGITLYGPPADRRAGIVSFNIEGSIPHDVAQILDLQGVAIRAGHHCCQPLMHKLGVAATNRASFYLYTIPEEIDQLVEGLYAVRKVFA